MGPTTDTEVLVVGAGPVGLMLAGELRLGGARVTVIDRLPTPGTESRASTLHSRTMEILQQRGLLAEFGTPPQVPRGHFGGLPLDLDGTPTDWPGQWKVPQTRTEELLGCWADRLGAGFLREHELRELEEDGGGVTVRVATPDGERRMRAAYVVGCDGEESTVRKLAGIPFPGTDAARELLRADVRGIDIPDRRFERHPRGLAIAGSLGGGVTRVMVHEFGRAPGDRAGAVPFAELAGAWSRVTGEDIGGGTPLWVGAFGDARRLAARYRQGRVLLAGDAAHQQLPVGGQALNLGLQDAVNLGWKLASAVRGRAGEELLESYHTERHAVGARVQSSVGAQARVLLGGPEVEGLRTVLGELLGLDEVRRRLATSVSGLDIRYPAPPGAHQLVGTWLAHEGLTAPLRAGRGAVLDLSGGPGPGSGSGSGSGSERRTALREAAAGWADRVAVASAAPSASSAPSAPSAPSADRLAGADTALVRPDGHVAWAGTGTTALRDALRGWFGAAR